MTGGRPRVLDRLGGSRYAWSMTGEQSKGKSGLSTRGAVLVTLGIVAILGMALFVGLWVIPFVKISNFVADYPVGPWAQKAIVRLGGKGRVARRLTTYLRLPRWLAPKKKSAVVLLSYCGEPAVDILVETLGKNAPDLRLMAVVSLSRLKSHARNAVPALIRALRVDDEFFRSLVAGALGSIGPDARAAVPVLVEALEDESKHVRSKSAQALGAIGPDSKPAVPRLIEMMKDDGDKFARARAALALGRIGSHPETVMAALTEALKDGDSYVRISAAWALAMFGPAAKEAVPALEDALKDEDERVRKQAAWSLKEIRGLGEPEE